MISRRSPRRHLASVLAGQVRITARDELVRTRALFADPAPAPPRPSGGHCTREHRPISYATATAAVPSRPGAERRSDRVSALRLGGVLSLRDLSHLPISQRRGESRNDFLCVRVPPAANKLAAAAEHRKNNLRT